MSHIQLTDDQIWEGDLLNRRDSAQFLYNYLIRNPEIRVLNINSAWGTGKTFFLERWQRSLQREHICINFNAWKNDFAIEPLIALASAVKNQLGEDSPAMQNFLHMAASTISAASPVVFHGLLNRLGGLGATGTLPAPGIEQTLELLQQQRPAEQTIEQFQHALRTVFADYQERHPELLDDVFIIIDEIDRCRPAFAIGLLERVKHFFGVENCRFIIASDSEQLGHSIRNIYGNEFDATTYMRRFFDLSFTLPEPDYATFIANNLPELGDGLGYLGLGSYGSRPEVQFLQTMASDFDISLRDLARCLKRISACHASLPACFLPMTSGLIFFRETRPADYRRLEPQGLAREYPLLGVDNLPYADPAVAGSAMDAFCGFIEHMDCSYDELLEQLQHPTADTSPLTRDIRLQIAQNYQQFRSCQKAVEMATHIQ